MIDIKSKESCCGCTACMNACPKKCISMKEDEEGFKYPHIDKSKCIRCGLCERTCPIIKQIISNEKNHKAYAIRSKEKEILSTSTSGGFFTDLANYVFDNNGVVVGASYENGIVKHILIDSKERELLYKLRGSKYVQSELGSVFTSIKEYLVKGRIVCFSGTPCQVNGLLKYLNKKYDNLITVDVICHGVPSPKLFKKYIEYQESKYNSKIKELNFRNKTYGYHSGTMKIVFENNKNYCGSARTDYMLKSFFSEISSRPSCYSCKFKCDNHPSDFTIFDCWNAKRLVATLDDDDRGYTNLFVNTQKGEEVFSIIKNKYYYYVVDKEKAIKYDGIMVRNSAKPNKNRNLFYPSLNEKGLDRTINELIPITKKDYFVEKAKKVLYKLGILKILKRIIKKG